MTPRTTDRHSHHEFDERASRRGARFAFADFPLLGKPLEVDLPASYRWRSTLRTVNNGLEEIMSRIHAFLIAILVTGAVAVGAATAFTVSNTSAKPGSALSSSVLQARANKINAAEKKLAKDLKNNPKPDRSPITKVIVVASSGGGGSYNSGSSSSGGGSTSTTPTVNHPRTGGDDHGEDHGEDHESEGGDHGSDD